MEKGLMVTRIPQLEDVPELIHSIQSLLPEKDAARTSVLSKSWLHAWSTNPKLRFSLFDSEEQQEDQFTTMINRTLNRYHLDNIPIENFELKIEIKNHEFASAVENWVRSVATKSCLKDLSLEVLVSICLFTLPDELFCGENLQTLSVTSNKLSVFNNPLCIGSNNVVIKCVFLRNLYLSDVQISVEVFDNLVATCSLLESITLKSCKGLDTIKIKNLLHLYEVIIDSVEDNPNLEIGYAPNLCLIYYSLMNIRPTNPLPFKTVSLSSLTELDLHGVIIDDSFFDMIKLKFPSLETLNLDTDCRRLESFNFRCDQLEHLFLRLAENRFIEEIQVHAPKLWHFGFISKTIPRLLFPAIAPENIGFALALVSPIDDSFFYKMRETFEISSVFLYIFVAINHFVDIVVPFIIDCDDLREKVLVPATNVQEIRFIAKSNDEGLLKRLSFFEAFFCICHPKYVVVMCLDSEIADGNHDLCKVIVRILMDSWPRHLTDVETKNPLTKKWEPLTRSFCDGPILPLDDRSLVKFKLNWHSL